MDYEIQYTKRKTVAIQISYDGTIVIKAPNRYPKSRIKEFVDQKRPWIESVLEKNKTAKEFVKKEEFSEEQLWFAKERAYEVLSAKTAYFAQKMGVTYNKITVRGQKTRWGSCSMEGNLSFNWKILLAPEPVIDYLVVHELAHRKEMNHSRRFYDEVKKVLPEYEASRAWLRTYGSGIIHLA